MITRQGQSSLERASCTKLNHLTCADRDLSLALLPLLLVKAVEDGIEAAPARLGLLVLAFFVAHAWRAVFAGGRLWLTPQAGQFSFALLFAVMLPETVGWGLTLLATSFGWVFGREIFGGKPLLSPALLALAFAIFSFPQSGFELQAIFSAPAGLPLALACIPGASWLLWRGYLSWQTIIGALLGAAATSLLLTLPGAVTWWEHFLLGSFPVGVIFLAAAPESAPQMQSARWLHGALVGGLIVAIRLLNPLQPDGVVFAVLIGALFAPLLDRATSWRRQGE